MSNFEIHWNTYALKLKEVFTISRSSRTEVPIVLLKITKEGITGYGEASPNSRYNESSQKVIHAFSCLPDQFFDRLKDPDDAFTQIAALNVIPSAKVAMEMAWLDWWAKSLKQPLWKLWEYEEPRTPVSSYTIGIDTPEKMQQKVRAASEFPIYKVKLGTDHDRELIKAIREVTDKPIRVDANEGWKSLDQALREIDFLAQQNVELIEQPMPSSMLQEMKTLKERSSLPLCADESFVGAEDLEELSEAFDILNIKLMKIGSLIKARNVLDQAHSLGLKVMIGCMVESSLANAAGALVALKADFADLDGHLLTSNDPFSGLKLSEHKEVVLSDAAGFGVEPI